MKNVYSKFDKRRLNAIKKRRTVKKRKNTYVKRKKTVKKKKTTHLVKLNRINQSGGKNIQREIKRDLKEIKKTNSRFDKHSDGFKTFLKLYKTQLEKYNNEYVSPINSDVNSILEKCINEDISLSVGSVEKYKERTYLSLKSNNQKEEIKKERVSLEYLRMRMILLNKIYRYSKNIGKTTNGTRFREKKNFYYKHRLSRGRRFITGNLSFKNSKIGRNFDTKDNLWGTLSLLRDYEAKLGKHKSFIKLEYTKLVANTKTKEGLIPRVTKALKQLPSNLIEKFDKAEIEKIKELKGNIDEPLKEFNKLTTEAIHYYFPPLNTTNSHLILMSDLPRKRSWGINTKYFSGTDYKYSAKVGNVMASVGQAIRSPFKIAIKDRDEYNDNGNINTKEIPINNHTKANDNIFNSSKKQILRFFKNMEELEEKKTYIEKYKIYHGNYRDFHSLNSLFIFDAEMKSYKDMGQYSLSYENKLTNTLKESRIQQISGQDGESKGPDITKIYLYNQNYFNNILHLPRFLLNNIKLIVLQNFGELNSIDLRSAANIKKDIPKINLFENDLNIKFDIEINDDNKLTNTLDLNNIKNDDKGEIIKIPASIYHAFFKIKNINYIKNINFSGMGWLGSKSIKIKNIKKLKDVKLLNTLFFINKREDVLQGSLLYLYKQIAYLTDFILNKDKGLFGLFIKDIFNIKDNEDNIKNIGRNLGMFNGIYDHRLYLIYAMIIYLEHCNRLSECVTELEEVTRIIYSIFTDKNKEKIDGSKLPYYENYEKLKNSKTNSIENKDVSSKSLDTSLISSEKYYDDQKLKSTDPEDLIKSDFKYKKLILDLQTNYYMSKSYAEINEIIQSILPKLENKKIIILDEFIKKLDINIKIKDAIKQINNHNDEIKNIYKKKNNIFTHTKLKKDEFKEIYTPEKIKNFSNKIKIEDVSSFHQELILLTASETGFDETNETNINDLSENIDLLLDENTVIFNNKDINTLLDVLELINLNTDDIEKRNPNSVFFKEKLNNAINNLAAIKNKNKENKTKIENEIQSDIVIVLKTADKSSNLDFDIEIKDKTDSDTETKLDFTSKTGKSILSKSDFDLKKNPGLKISNHPTFINKYNLSNSGIEVIIKEYNNNVKYLLKYYKKYINFIKDISDAVSYKKNILYVPFQFLLLKTNTSILKDNRNYFQFDETKTKNELNIELSDEIKQKIDGLFKENEKKITVKINEEINKPSGLFSEINKNIVDYKRKSDVEKENFINDIKTNLNRTLTKKTKDYEFNITDIVLILASFIIIGAAFFPGALVGAVSIFTLISMGVFRAIYKNYEKKEIENKKDELNKFTNIQMKNTIKRISENTIGIFETDSEFKKSIYNILSKILKKDKSYGNFIKEYKKEVFKLIKEKINLINEDNKILEKPEEKNYYRFLEFFIFKFYNIEEKDYAEFIKNYKKEKDKIIKERDNKVNAIESGDISELEALETYIPVIMQNPKNLNNDEIAPILNEYKNFSEKVDKITKNTDKTIDIFNSFKLKTTSLLQNTLSKIKDHFILLNIDEL